MTYDEAIEYIHSISWTGSRPGLERITELCAKMGNIQDSLKYVHVAGTNGKGSFCSMLGEICRKAGMRVGTFTSPFVYRFNERICVDSEPIPDDELARLIEKIKPLAQSMEDAPTEFELINALGFLYFYEKKCDIVILEAGMGGRLDSTNVIKTPTLSVITGIALDHTAFLGDTKEKIAEEKAGIIKSGIPVLYGKAEGKCCDIICGKAVGKDSPSVGCDYTRLSNIKLSLDGSKFNFNPYNKPFNIALAGAYQPYNAALAITAAEMLGIDEGCIYEGLAAARWRARFEVISRDPVVIYDGGHNPDGVRQTINSVKEVFDKKINVLTGVMKDKDYTSMAQMISEVADNVYCMASDNPRALDAEKYADEFRKNNVNAQSFDSMKNALKCAYMNSVSQKKPLVVMGSLYIYRDFIDAFEELTDLSLGV